MPSQLLSGWLRVALVICVLWVVAALFLYFGGIGEKDWPIWMSAWVNAFPLWKQMPLYEQNCQQVGSSLFNVICNSEFSAMGLGTLIFYPILWVVLVFLGIVWIARGFSERDRSE